MAANKDLDHHDIGFLYSLSSKAQWIVDKDEEARKLTLQAADALMKRWKPKSHSEYGYFQAEAGRGLLALVEKYSTLGEPEAQGLLKHGSYSVNHGLAPDDYIIWGDYYYLEALLRIDQGIKGYWYEK